MARISRAHPARVALLACAVAALAAFFFSAPAANAGLLEPVTGPVEEGVSPVVGATPTVQQVEETVTTTAHEVTAKITPSAAKTADAASSPAAGRAGGLPEPADALTDKATKLASDAASAAGVPSAAGAANPAADGAVHAATEGAEGVTGSTLPDSPVSSAALDPAASSAAPASAAAPTGTGAPTASRTTYVPPPGNDGSTGAPLPRWIAYVWPAVALIGPSLATFGESWGKAIVRLATVASSGNGAEGAVAGVHASGGRPEAAGPSPVFSSIPSDVGHAFSSVPTPVFIYLGLLVLAVIAVALAVRREIAVGRRQ
jgi:hypothetical protein